MYEYYTSLKPRILIFQKMLQNSLIFLWFSWPFSIFLTFPWFLILRDSYVSSNKLPTGDIFISREIEEKRNTCRYQQFWRAHMFRQRFRVAGEGTRVRWNRFVTFTWNVVITSYVRHHTNKYVHTYITTCCVREEIRMIQYRSCIPHHGLVRLN